MSDRPPVTAAVIGLGDISVQHLDAIQRNPDVRLAAVCDIDPARADRTAAAFGVPGFTDHRTLLRDVRPQVVHVTTPHHQHVPIAMDAIEAGAHLLTEKPIAHTAADGQRLVERASAASTKVGVVLQNRYNPTSVAIHDLVQSGGLGPIVGGRAAVWWSRTAAYYEAAPWRGRWSEGGGGVLINQAIHTLDLLIWFLGDPVAVHGSAATLALSGTIEVEDTATVALEHEGGTRSVLFATNAHHTNAGVELEITGRDGAVALVNGEAVLTTTGGSRVLTSDAPAGGARSYWGQSHSALIDDFYTRLDEPEPFWLGPAVGLTPLRVLREVYAQSGLLRDGEPQ